MSTTSTTKTPRGKLNLRIPHAECNLIDRAAESVGKTRSDFILEAACRAAEETLLDRALMVAGPEAHGEFLKRLDQPAQPNERLRKTMHNKTPWKAA